MREEQKTVMLPAKLWADVLDCIQHRRNELEAEIMLHGYAPVHASHGWVDKLQRLYWVLESRLNSGSATSPESSFVNAARAGGLDMDKLAGAAQILVFHLEQATAGQEMEKMPDEIMAAMQIIVEVAVAAARKEL